MARFALIGDAVVHEDGDTETLGFAEARQETEEVKSQESIETEVLVH